MNKKSSLSLQLLAACCAMLVSQRPAVAGEVTLEDNQTLAAFDSDSGALTRLVDKQSHWVIERRPELGVSFRLFAPLPERRYNPVFGQKQHAAEIKKVSDKEIKIRWQDLLSENGGKLPMSFAADITLSNGVLAFAATLQNDSPLTVETIDYPYFGDLNAPGRDSFLEARTPRDNQGTDTQPDELYPHFRNEKGYWGVDWPTKMLEAQPSSAFCLLQAPGQGICVDAATAKLPYRLFYMFEQHPGVISAATSLVPSGDYISGFPVHLEFHPCHFVFAKPHSTTELVPIILRPYNGDWHAGVELFKQQHQSASNP